MAPKRDSVWGVRKFPEERRLKVGFKNCRGFPIFSMSEALGASPTTAK
jgi:hypothetical protein